MWSTKSAAIKEIIDRTGIPEVEAEKAVKAMPTKPFGKRDMVHKLNIETFIAETNQPPVQVTKAGNIRPFSPRTIAKIKTLCVPSKRRSA
jgi:hypothetical protein